MRGYEPAGVGATGHPGHSPASGTTQYTADLGAHNTMPGAGPNNGHGSGPAAAHGARPYQPHTAHERPPRSDSLHHAQAPVNTGAWQHAQPGTDAAPLYQPHLHAEGAWPGTFGGLQVRTGAGKSSSSGAGNRAHVAHAGWHMEPASADSPLAQDSPSLHADLMSGPPSQHHLPLSVTPGVPNSLMVHSPPQQGQQQGTNRGSWWLLSSAAPHGDAASNRSPAVPPYSPPRMRALRRGWAPALLALVAASLLLLTLSVSTSNSLSRALAGAGSTEGLLLGADGAHVHVMGQTQGGPEGAKPVGRVLQPAEMQPQAPNAAGGEGAGPPASATQPDAHAESSSSSQAADTAGALAGGKTGAIRVHKSAPPPAKPDPPPAAAAAAGAAATKAQPSSGAPSTVGGSSSGSGGTPQPLVVCQCGVRLPAQLQYLPLPALATYFTNTSRYINIGALHVLWVHDAACLGRGHTNGTEASLINHRFIQYLLTMLHTFAPLRPSFSPFRATMM